MNNIVGHIYEGFGAFTQKADFQRQEILIIP
jgi:hypothetical protein